MLESINDVNGYLQQFGGALAQKIQTEAEPLFKPGNDWHPRMNQLLRKPFQAQADAIQGAVETLRTHNHVMCIGEMGVGKTLIGAAVPYIMENGHPPRVLVMCPGHLTRKWVREVRETVPGAEAKHSQESVRCAWPLILEEPHRGLRYYVVSKERAKLSYAWRPAFNLRRGVPVCPDCGSTMVDRDGVEVDPGDLAAQEDLVRCMRRCPVAGGQYPIPQILHCGLREALPERVF